MADNPKNRHRTRTHHLTSKPVDQYDKPCLPHGGIRPTIIVTTRALSQVSQLGTPDKGCSCWTYIRMSSDGSKTVSHPTVLGSRFHPRSNPYLLSPCALRALPPPVCGRTSVFPCQSFQMNLIKSLTTNTDNNILLPI